MNDLNLGVWDVFAAASLTGYLSRMSDPVCNAAVSKMASQDGTSPAVIVAELAAEHADAMMSERKKRKDRK